MQCKSHLQIDCCPDTMVCVGFDRILGRSGGAKVLGKLSAPGRPTNLYNSSTLRDLRHNRL